MKINNQTYFYLGPNFNSFLVDRLLKIDKSIMFVESAIYPEITISKSALDNYKKKIIYFDINLLTKSQKLSVSKKSYLNNLEVVEKVLSDKLIPLLWTRSPFFRRIYNFRT